MGDLVIQINLPGKIKGPRVHTHTQSVRNPINNKFVKIKHSDRGYQSCYRKTTISSDVVRQWSSDAAPSFIPAKTWKKMTSQQRIEAHILSFDEGYGVSHSYVEN